MNKCQNCDHPLALSDRRQFDIQKKWVPENARRMTLSNLSLLVCRNCGLMWVSHKHQGFQGAYKILYHGWWEGQFRNHRIETMLQADLAYEQGGYKHFISRADFKRDFEFQKSRWGKHGGKKPRQINQDQNRLFE